MPAELEDDDLMNDSEESDELPSDLDDLSVDSDGEEEDAEEKDEDDDDAFSLVEGSDAEDLLSLDAEVPMGMIEYDGSDASDEEGDDEAWGGISSETQKKGKRKRDGDERKAQRKKLRALPTFASYEDYAKMIEDTPEDNI